MVSNSLTPSRKRLWRPVICTGAALSALVMAAACSSGPPSSDEDVGSTGEVGEAIQTASTVMVNQLGYARGAQKVGVVINASSTAGTIEVLNSSNSVVWTGGSTTVKAADANSGDKVHHADFSGFSTAGTGYKLRVTIGGTAYTSEPFDVSDTVYNPASGLSLAKGAMKYFYWKRDGAYTVAADTTYNINGHGQSHMGDSSRTAHVDTTGGGSSPWTSVTFDTQGGHLDAGDFSKYVESDTAKAFYLANMFERTKGVADPSGVAIDTLDLGFTDGGLPDVLAEIAWGVRAVRGMLPSPTVHKTGADLAADCAQNPDGVTPSNSVVPCKWLAGNKLAGDAWAQWVNIDADTANDRYVCGPSTSATYSVARNLAHISRLVKPYGTAATIIGLDGQSNLTAAAYADKLWDTAKEAFGRAAGRYPGDANYTGKGATIRESDLKPKQGKGFNDGSGFYGDSDSWDDRHAAEVELYLTACQRGDATAATLYKGLVTAHSMYKQMGPCDWGSEVPLGDPLGEERGCATLSLLTSAETLCTGGNALPAADITAMKNNLYAYADNIVANMNGQNYPFYVADGGQVPWGSNAAQLSSVVILTMAYEKGGNKNYLKSANRLMDYILGVNPMKMSYVIGFGDAAETVTHDRAMKATGKYVKGTVVGGPHNLDNNFGALATYWGGGPGIDDTDTPDSGPVLKHMAVVSDPANSWESQENAVNWNAALANAVWGLAIHNDELGCSTSAECDDGNLCTTDSCSAGTCTNTMTTACNDGRACTVDSCVPSTGACVNDTTACCATDGGCSDGTACSEDVCGANEMCSNPWRSTCTTTSTTTALTRAAAASSSDETASSTADKAIDADTASTRWASSFADDQWLRIDMGQKRFVNRVKLIWEAAASREYYIEVADAANGPWTRIYTTTAGDGGTDDLTSANGLTPSSGRYVRMYGKTRTTGYGHSLYDMAVYGHAGTTTASCGDNSCDGTESSTCTADCGAGAPPTCGDAACNGTETCSTCAGDCGACAETCGNATCAGSETCSTCAADCGTCAPSCGDGSCNGGETCSSCQSDCGACPPVCGDDTCSGGETCSSCAADCGSCPTNTAVYMEAEAGTLSGGFTSASDANAFGGSYIMPPAGASAAAPGAGRAVFSATVAAGTYTLWARVIGPTADDDSMWVKVTNSGGTVQGTPQTGAVSSFIKSNDHTATSWTWKKIHNSDGGGATTGVMSYALAAGTYTIEIANREDGLKIDRLYLTKNGDTPTNTLCTCADDGNPCTVDACDASQVCQHTAGNAGGVCRASAGGCDVAETCTGSSTACPADGFANSGTVCRAASSAGCDVAETCTGGSAACPTDAFMAAGTTCRAAAGACDVAESCPGGSASCPTNGYVANGTTCNDSSACTTSDVCTNGSCGGTALSCNDGVSCTSDSCNPATGCVYSNLSSGTTCDDGNASTCSDVCNGSGVCGGTTCASCTPSTAGCEYQMAGNVVAVEAEHFFATSTSGVTTGDSWTVQSAGAASGGQCMMIGPDNTNTHYWNSATTVPSQTPKVDYKVNITTAGTYYLHVKGDAPDGNGDSYFGAIDGSIKSALYTGSAFSITPNTWGWSTISLGSVTAGIHTITIMGREDGLKIDKLQITNSATAPTGMGAAESALN